MMWAVGASSGRPLLRVPLAQRLPLFPGLAALVMLSVCLLQGAQAQDGPCAAKPCLNNAIRCTEQGDTYTCTCRPGFVGQNCEKDEDNCAKAALELKTKGIGDNAQQPDAAAIVQAEPTACLNGGRCKDLVDNYRCECKEGYRGRNCEIFDWYTLQQWEGATCEDEAALFRCFRMRMDKCSNTHHYDGAVAAKDYWYGRLKFEQGRYSIDLCWGGATEGDVEDPLDPLAVIPESKCECPDNKFVKIPKLGKNSLGPPTLGKRDSDECHKLKGVTSSRLVNSTGFNDKKVDNLRCFACKGSEQGILGVAVVALLLSLLGTD